MSDRQRLEALLRRIDGRSYPAWKDLGGTWDLDDWTLVVDHVQGDPFAAPSRVRIRIPEAVDPTPIVDRDARTAAEDWLLRLARRHLPRSRRGSGKSGAVQMLAPGPEVMERSAVRLGRDGTVELRIRIGLPARGRRVLGREGRGLLFEDLPGLVSSVRAGDAAHLRTHIDSVRRQRQLRRALRKRGLVAFVEDGSLLPRTSGVSQQPLTGGVPFESPESLRTTLPTEFGPATGMGLREGVVAIVGGGFHGKSTVLGALQRGHLDHIPGDGREGVVTVPDTVKIRAEDGRSVVGVDISAFLHDLPGDRSTRPFSTEDASGSTSQAAAIAEALESGARVLLFDEDTSATNLMVRDARMRALIPANAEPITPLVERVRTLYRERGVSTVLAIGGVGDWLGVADVVLAMEDWRPRDATTEAKALGIAIDDAERPLEPLLARIPAQRGLEPGKIRARDGRAVRYGDSEIELVAVEQVLNADHAWSLGQALAFLHDELVDGKRTMRQLLDALDAILDDEGVDVLSPRKTPDGGLIRPTRHEVAAALNRLRTLEIRHPQS